CVALRTFADLRQFQYAVISPAHALTACRWFTFWDAHNSNQNCNLSSLVHADGSSFLSPDFWTPLFFFNPPHSGLHNGCCGNSSSISSRTKGVKSMASLS